MSYEGLRYEGAILVWNMGLVAAKIMRYEGVDCTILW